MAYGRVSMRKTREILRLKFEARLSHRQIGRACGVSCSTVSEAVGRFQAAELSWPLPAELPDSALEARLYRERGETASDTREPDWQHVHKELARRHVTLGALWGEYKKAHPDGYQYSWFCAAYRAWAAKIDVVMRFQHKAGEKLFVDWAGDTVPIVDPASGEVRPAYLFVAVLGASSYTYVEAAASQDSEAFLAAHVRAFEFYGGCARILVPDNLKTGVQKADRYEPTINRAYADLAAHYGAAVIPARAGRPRDKAKVENAVLFSYRALLVPLRDRIFFSLPELNAALGEQLRLLNERPFQKLDGSRRSVFLELDAPALLPLPAEPYGCHTRRRARVHIDYHVELERHCYSVPYQLAREEVEIVFSASLVEVFHDGQRVASHVRSGRRGGFTTDPAHMPAAHREVASSGAGAHGGLGGEDRARYGSPGDGDHGGARAPGAGLPQLPRRPAPRRQARRGAPRGGLRAGAHLRGALLQVGQVDPREAPRERRPARRPCPAGSRRSRERARARLLHLKGCCT